MQEVKIEYTEPEEGKEEEEDGCSKAEHAVRCYCLHSGLLTCSFDLLGNIKGSRKEVKEELTINIAAASNVRRVRIGLWERERCVKGLLGVNIGRWEIILGSDIVRFRFRPRWR